MKIERRNHFLLLFLAILFVNSVVFSPCINAYFVNDDCNWIKSVAFSEVISTFWGGWGHFALFRPLTRLLLYIQFLVFNESPAGYHVVSLIFHSSLIFVFCLLIIAVFAKKTSFFFLFASIIFFYPHHEVVCWISAQTILLSGNLIVLSVLFFILSYREAQARKLYILSLLFFLLSLLSYEASVVVPIICLLSVQIKYKLRWTELKPAIIRIVPFVLLMLIYLLYRKIILAGLPEANELTVNPLNWIESFLKLLKFQFAENLFLLVFYLAGASYLLFVKREAKILIFSIVWFFVCYAPFLLINGYTGRFAFLSMFGIIFLIGSFSEDLYYTYRKYRLIILAVFIGYISFNAVKLYQNSSYWQEAGEISRTIPLQVKSLHENFPENSTLIFYDIPLGYQQAGVFLTYFEDAVQRKYNEKLDIIHVAHPLNKGFNDSLFLDKPNVYRFKYFLDSRQLIEINKK